MRIKYNKPKEQQVEIYGVIVDLTKDVTMQMSGEEFAGFVAMALHYKDMCDCNAISRRPESQKFVNSFIKELVKGY